MLFQKEVTWGIKMVVADSAEVRDRCTKRFAQTAIKNVKSLSSPAEIVRYTAGSVSQNANKAAVNRG
jgi:hypothetical protein